MWPELLCATGFVSIVMQILKGLAFWYFWHRINMICSDMAIRKCAASLHTSHALKQ